MLEIFRSAVALVFSLVGSILVGLAGLAIFCLGLKYEIGPLCLLGIFVGLVGLLAFGLARRRG